jgi:serine/threonine protein kinase
MRITPLTRPVSAFRSLKDFWLNDRLADYRLDRRISKTLNSRVYEATKADRADPVALKVAYNHSMDSIETEGLLLSFGLSPGFPGLIAKGRSGHYNYLAMELISGDTLANIMAAPGDLTVSESVALITQTCAIIADLHAAGLLHRDIKPDNIMIEPEGRVRVIDLGLAVSIGHRDRGMALGTFGYISPEQSARMPLDERTDIHSLGLVAQDLCATKVNRALMEKTRQGKRFEQLALAMSEYERENRPAKITEVLAELEYIKGLPG